MKILFSIANSISSRLLFDKVLEDSGFSPDEIVVMRLSAGEQNIVRWAIENDFVTQVNPHNLDEICDLVDAAIVIRRNNRNCNSCDAAVARLRELGKPVHVHEMSNVKFQTPFGKGA